MSLYTNNISRKRSIPILFCYIPAVFTFLQNMHFLNFSSLTLVTATFVIVLFLISSRSIKLYFDSTIDYLILLLSAFILLSVTVSSSFQASIEFVSIFFIGILMYYLLSCNSTWIQNFYKALFFLALINLIITILSFIDFQLFKSIFYRFLTGKAIEFTDSYYSKFGFHAGIMGQTGTNSVVLSMGFPYLVGCISRNEKKIPYIALFVMFLFGIVITGKRGAFIYVLITSFIIYAIKQSKEPSSLFKKIFAMIFLLLLLYFAYCFIEPFTILIDRLIPNSDSVTDLSAHRFDLYSEAISVFKSNPIIGIGIGAYPVISVYSNNVHNDFLEMFAEMGIFGGLTYLILCLILLANSIKLCAASNKMTESMYLIMFLSLTSMTGIVIYNYGFMLIFFVCVAAIRSEIKDRSNKNE